MTWLLRFRDKPCAVRDIPSRLDALRRLSRPPVVKHPGKVLDSKGREVAPSQPQPAVRPSGIWDANHDARKL